MAHEALTTYLNDHLAGAAAALQLLDQLTDASETAEDKQFFTALHADISEDRDVLENLLKKAGGQPSGLRQVGGWVAAKVGQLKLAIDNPARGTLDRLQALEVLALGIQGKMALWRALRVAGPGLPEVRELDLDRLERRALDQHERVEARRVTAAERALQAES